MELWLTCHMSRTRSDSFGDGCSEMLSITVLSCRGSGSSSTDECLQLSACQLWLPHLDRLFQLIDILIYKLLKICCWHLSKRETSPNRHDLAPGFGIRSVIDEPRWWHRRHVQVTGLRVDESSVHIFCKRLDGRRVITSSMNDDAISVVD